MNNDNPKDPKIVFTVDRWSLFRGVCNSGLIVTPKLICIFFPGLSALILIDNFNLRFTLIESTTTYLTTTDGGLTFCRSQQSREQRKSFAQTLDIKSDTHTHTHTHTHTSHVTLFSQYIWFILGVNVNEGKGQLC